MNGSLRALMLGWEYPPRYAGGLGKACRGLSQALARQGVQVFFVLPTFPEKISEPGLEVVGARECLIEAGWSPGKSGEPSTIRTDARLFPYGTPPEGPPPESLAEGGARADDTRRAASPESSENPSELYGRNFWQEIERFAVSTRQLAGTHEVDVVHAHDWMTFPAAFEFHRVTGVPVFLHVHATEYDRSGEAVNNEVYRIEREGFRRATHIFAVSRYTAGVIEKLYGVNRKKISVLYNAPDEDVKELKTLPGAPRKRSVVFLGRLTFQKGPDHFLKAAALVAEADPKARFQILGTGDLLEKMKQETHRLGLEDRVHFTGFVGPSEVDEILSHSRVLVMPSVSEPFGLVALEAIHCGIPVIISKQSGVREVLQRALQVDFWDHERLADQILAALRLPDLSRQLVEEGLDQIRHLSWDASALKCIEVWRSHLGLSFAQNVRGGHAH